MLKYGWKPELPDIRDLYYNEKIGNIPNFVDMRSDFKVPYNQGNLGSCVANSVAANIDINRRRSFIYAMRPSRLFIYYHARHFGGFLDEDAGCYIRDAIKSINKYGVPPEDLWPYDEKLLFKKPNDRVMKAAEEYKVVKYYRLNNENINELKHCLASSYPFVFGMTMYENFGGEYIKMPRGKPLGGHAMLAVGYTPTHFIVLNSWGSDWGVKGFCYIPKEYLTSRDLADDFWVIK